MAIITIHTDEDGDVINLITECDKCPETHIEPDNSGTPDVSECTKLISVQKTEEPTPAKGENNPPTGAPIEAANGTVVLTQYSDGVSVHTYDDENELWNEVLIKSGSGQLVDAYLTKQIAATMTPEPTVKKIDIVSRAYYNVAASSIPELEFQTADGRIWQLVSRPVKATDVDDPTSLEQVTAIAQAAHDNDLAYHHNVGNSVDVVFNPTANAFAMEGTIDADYLTHALTGLNTSFRTPANLETYEGYKRTFNSYQKSIEWAETVTYAVAKGAVVWMNLAAGEHNVYGHMFVQYEGSNIYLRGEGAQVSPFTDVTFTSTGQGDYTYDAKLGYTGTLTPAIGSAIGIRHSEGSDPVADGSADTLNGAFEVVANDTTTKTLTIRTYDARNVDDGSFNLNPTLGVNTPLSGFTPHLVTAPTAVLKVWGGYNGKSPEAFMNFEYGTTLTVLDGIAIVGSAPPENNPLEVGSNRRDRKLLFFRSANFRCLGQTVLLGGSGSTVRTFGTSHLHVSAAIIGGITTNYISRVGWRLQQDATFEMARVTTGGYTQNCLQINDGCSGSYHTSILANAGEDRLSAAEVTALMNNFNEGDDIELGSTVWVIDGGSVTLNSARILWSGRATMIQGEAAVTIGTHIRNVDMGLTWRDGEGSGTPTFINNVFNFENAASDFNKVLFGGHWGRSRGQTETGYT